MSIAYGATSTLGNGSGTRSWSHAASGSPAGAIVFVTGGGVSETSDVTYGEVSMTRIETWANVGGSQADQMGPPSGTVSVLFKDIGSGDLVAEWTASPGFATYEINHAGNQIHVLLEWFAAAVPGASHVYFAEVWNVGNLIAQLRWRNDNQTIQMRDGATADWTSAALGAGRHQAYWRVDLGAGEHEMEIFSGADLDTATPTQTSRQDNNGNPHVLTGAGQTVMSVLKLGLTASTTFTYELRRAEVDSATRPTFANVDVANATVTGIRVQNGTTWASWKVDTTASVGTPVTLVQRTVGNGGGPSVGTITDTAGVFSFADPGGTEDLVFDLTAGAASRVVTITRSGVLVGNRAILKGGVWRRM